METSERPASRRRFLKKAGVLLAVAVGAGALVQSASATVLCCGDTSCGHGNCGDKYPCTCDCGSCFDLCQGAGQCTACPC
jgi:hypothetical protein